MNLSLSPALDKLTNLKAGKVENILVVRQHNQIGDMLCSLSLYAALKKKYPDSEITLVAAKTNYAIPFFELNPFLDRVIVFEKQNIKSLFNFFRKLRKRKYQIGIVPSTIKVSRTSHIINFLSGAKIRVGIKSIDGIKNNSHKLLNVKSDFIWKNTHQLDRNLEVAKQINCNLSEEDKTSLKFRYSDEDKSFARNFIEETFPGNHRKILGFHPGAGKADNMWSTKNFIELIIKLYNKYNNYVLLTMGKIDGAVISTVEGELNKHNIDYKILGTIPIKQQGAILSLIDIFITNDTGSMHIAGFSDARMISLFGPTNPEEWAPSGENKFIIKSKTGSIDDISVEEVYSLTEKILENEK
jgi:ADP-heptose:LPS heptosyltransferase